MKAKGKKPSVWANGVNLAGIWFQTPRRMFWCGESEAYWDHSGDFDAKKLGQNSEMGVVTFASESKAEVEAWTLGAQAVMSRLKEWCK